MPSRCQRSFSSTPSRPTIFIRVRLPLTSKPVPKTMVSAARSVPSVVTMPVARHLPDAVGDQLDVVAAEGGVVVVADQDALAADLVVGGQPLPQRGVAHLPRQLPARLALQALHQPRADGEADAAQLERPVDQCPDHPLADRELGVQGALGGADRAVGLPRDPRRRALVDVEVRGHRRDLRHELDRAGAGADDRDPLAGQVVFVVPVRGVEGRALEPVEARQVGIARLVQRPHAGGDHLRGEHVTGAGLHRPEWRCRRRTSRW